MASEINFVETDSMNIYNAIIGSLMDSCNEPLYPGDERRIFGDALVMVFVSLYNEFNDKQRQTLLKYARGVVLDAIGERLRVYRADAAAASATFRFTVGAAQDSNILIPAGTRITNDGSVYFATEETATLPAGELFVDVHCICTEGGSAYNGLAAGAVSTLVDLIPYIVTATNITATSGGDDGEPYTEEGDERFRERIRLAPKALSTAGTRDGYRYHVLSADPDIVDVAIEVPEDKPNTINLYPLMRDGALPDEATLAKVLAACSADNVRPMTDFVQVFAPTVVEYQIEVKYYCTQDDEATTIEAIEGEGGAIDQYIEWQSAALSRGINPDKLRSFMLSPSSGTGAIRVDVISPTYTALAKSQIAKLSGTLTVTHEVVSDA